MRKLFSLGLVVMTFLAGVPAHAGPDEVAEVLQHQREHGFDTPAAAITQLLAAGKDSAGAPVDLRMRYHNSLAQLYVSAEDVAGAQRHFDELERMAKQENCTACELYRQVRLIHQAVRQQDGGRARQLLTRLDGVTVPDKDLMQAIHYTRAGVLDSEGSHNRAIEEGLIASRLAIETKNYAEQVRALNLMLLANVKRKDLDRALGLAKEAFALAERIGYIYMLPYIRGNEGWIYSLKGDKPKQLRALNDVLAITRKYNNMGDSELIALVNLAEYHWTAREYKLAADLAREAVALADKTTKPIAKGVAMSTLGSSQVQLGEVDKGLATIAEGCALLDKAKANSYLMSCYGMQAEVLESAGRYQPALASLRKYVKMNEESNARAGEKAVAEAQEKFSGERKDHEIERLSLENGRRQAEVAAKAWQQRLWATAALALALGAILLIQMIARARRRNRALEDTNAVLSDQSVHDPLTGAYNRRHCAELMGQQQLILANKVKDRTHKASVGLMLLDVDHFKNINDTYGHSAGDAVLVEMARRLQQLVRQHDVVVRWGGEEFVLVLPGTSTDGLLVLADRVLKVIAESNVVVDNLQIPVTVSLGAVCFPLLADQNWEDCLKVADLCMYMSKQTGRNRATCVMEVQQGVTSEMLLTDVGKAAEAGLVTLQTVKGPVQVAERDNLVTI